MLYIFLHNILLNDIKKNIFINIELEDDSESYLGLWFKETLAPETIEPEPPEVPPETVTTTSNKGNNFVSDREEPHEVKY